MRDETGQDIGMGMYNVIANVNEGESFIYGISGDPTSPSNTWNDITDPEIYKDLSLTTSFTSQDVPYTNTFLPGNCMIKAYTTENEPGSIPATGIEFEDSDNWIYLSTNLLGVNSIDISASLLPSDSTSDITYYTYPEEVVTVTQDGNIAHLTAVSEGEGKLIAKTSNGFVATRDIKVSNHQFVTNGVTINTNQETIGIEINNLEANPAFGQTGNPTSVSVFIWSEDDMSDAKAIPALQIPDTNNWITSAVGINYTDSYLLQGDQIKYVVCIGDSNHSITDQVFSGFASWVSPGLEEQGNVSYIAYNQNIGFVTPTVHSGMSGVIGNARIAHMEGLRVSSGIPGVNVITTVHASDLGWMDPVGDGVYAGTMHQNRALEAIQLDLDTTLDNYQISYRVYIASQGWTDWVSEGETAGTTGQGLPIQAVDIQITQN